MGSSDVSVKIKITIEDYHFLKWQNVYDINSFNALWWFDKFHGTAGIYTKIARVEQ